MSRATGGARPWNESAGRVGQRHLPRPPTSALIDAPRQSNFRLRASFFVAIITTATTPDSHPDCRALLIQIVALHERRLSAILAADVAGYSRLMHDDEEATHAKLTALLREAVHPAIAEHGGRIVKNTGDGFLAEFPSAVDAVRAAMQFQTRVHEYAIDEAGDRIAFRVGINIGDVIVEPHDIF